jgi:hypothetical protein
MVKPTYIYRDPRDALLSAYEYGERKRTAGRRGPFADLTTLDTAIDFMVEYIHISEAWLACEQSLNLRYEDLLLDYDGEVARILRFLEMDADQIELASVIDQYRPDRGRSDQKGTHFVKGKIGRYREKLTVEQQRRCLELFGAYLERMGYPTDME